jgi:hypothetical protein
MKSKRIRILIEKKDPQLNEFSFQDAIDAIHPGRWAVRKIGDKTKETKRELDKILKLSKKYYSTKHLPQDPNPRSPEQQREFRDILDYKRDAFRHILANAWFGQKFPHSAMRMAGETNEFFGAFKSLLKGKGFKSGRKMDVRNNELGLALSKKFLPSFKGKPSVTLEQTALEVKHLIDNGRFFVEYKGVILSYSDLDSIRDTAKAFVGKDKEL